MARCNALTRTGKKCKNTVTPPDDHCILHRTSKGVTASNSKQQQGGGPTDKLKLIWDKIATGTDTFNNDLTYFNKFASAGLSESQRELLWNKWLANDSPRKSRFMQSTNTIDNRTQITCIITPGYDIFVVHMNVVLIIPRGRTMYVKTEEPDNTILIGYHGSYDPPLDMSGNLLWPRPDELLGM